MPAIAALPWLASFLGSIFFGLASFLTQHITRKFALVIAAITALGTLTAAFFAVLYGLIQSIHVVMPSYIAQFAFLLPSNFEACLAVALSAKTFAWAYSWNVRIIQMKLF